jgi:hypothetical protein
MSGPDYNIALFMFFVSRSPFLQTAHDSTDDVGVQGPLYLA